MAQVPTFDTYLLRFWDQVCDIAANYSDVIALKGDIKARDKLVNVLWDTQRDEFLTMASNAMTTANGVIDAVRGVEPRPVLPRPVQVGDEPLYPLEFDRSPRYGNAAGYSYTRVEFNPPAALPVGVPEWWYIGSNLYLMVVRAYDYVTIPVEPVSGITLGVWGASMWYGVIGLQLLHNGYATARNSAESASTQIIQILNEKSRRNR